MRIDAPLRSFATLLGKGRAAYLGSTLCDGLLGGAEGLIHPLLMKAIFDAAARRDDFGHFIWLALGYLALGVFMNVAGYVLALWQARVDNRIVGDISVALLRSYYARDYGEVLRNGSGHYVARIRSDVKDGVVPMLTLVRTVTSRCFTFVALMSVLVFISWQALLTLAIIIPVAAAISLGVGRKIQALTSAERENEAVLMNALARSVAAFRMVCTFSLVSRTVVPFARSLDDVLGASYRKLSVIRRLQATSDLVMVVCDACSIFVGAVFVFLQRMTIGSFIAFMNAFWRSATTLIEVFRLSAELHSHVATARRVLDFMHASPAPRRHRPGTSLEADSIGFGYEGGIVLDAFSMRLAPGQSALVLGPNGTGKTTLANILSGYLMPSSGALALPGRISASTLPLAFPPIKVGELGIDPELLMRFGIGTDDIADAFPDRLSAGQQQKVSLAMVLSRDADLYILDEPLANLDTGSRQVAMEEIRRRTAGRMLVAIMHGGEEFHSMFGQVHYLGVLPTRDEPAAASA